MGIFSLDGKLAAFLNKIGDLIVLNVLTLLCSLPLVTAGAALTALYSVTLKMVRNEEGSVVKNYMQALRKNFRQATVLWLLSAAGLLLLVFDYGLLRYYSGTAWTVYKGILLAVFLFAAVFVNYLFPVLARFVNSTKNTAKNAALFAMIHPLQAVLMLVTGCLPLILLMISLRFLFLEVLLGISGPAFLASLYYRRLFQGFELGEAAKGECR